MPGITPARDPTVSVVIVAWNSRGELEKTLPAALAELSEGDELILVDNASQDGTAAMLAHSYPLVRLLEMETNIGFAAAANEGARSAACELLVFLNPDARPLPGFGKAIRGPLREGARWAAWMSLVACDHGRFVNSAGNRVHFTGIAWAGGHGEPRPETPEAREVTAASGACFAIPRTVWGEVGGFAEDFFLYHEDVDLSLRLRLGGHAIGIEPGAVVDHDYEFGSRQHKWRWLERNRWAFVIRVYPAPLLALVLPAMLLTELALIPIAAAGGWGAQKVAAGFDVARWLPRLVRERRALQRTRVVSAAEFATWLTPDLDSPFIGSFARGGLVRAGLRGYWRGVVWCLGRWDRRSNTGEVRPAGSSAGSESR